eukprot:gene41982-51248_t
MYKIHSVKALSKHPNTEEASQLLKRLVQATSALLVRRQWNVPLLQEFLPKQQGLLGMNINGGSKILIRLREHENNNVFLPWESLLGTLVHELVHIEIGPHSFEFYKLVDELWDEVQKDIISGRSSATSTSNLWSESKGHKLGGSSSSVNQLTRDLAAQAALRRLNNSSSSSGNRLGGSSRGGMSAKELMAQAAERRVRDRQTCSDTLTAEEQRDIISASQEVDLTEIDYCQPCEPRGKSASSGSSAPAVIVLDDDVSEENQVNRLPTSSSSSSKRSREVMVLDGEE